MFDVTFRWTLDKLGDVCSNTDLPTGPLADILQGGPKSLHNWAVGQPLTIADFRECTTKSLTVRAWTLRVGHRLGSLLCVLCSCQTYHRRDAWSDPRRLSPCSLPLPAASPQERPSRVVSVWRLASGTAHILRLSVTWTRIFVAEQAWVNKYFKQSSYTLTWVQQHFVILNMYDCSVAFTEGMYLLVCSIVCF